MGLAVFDVARFLALLWGFRRATSARAWIPTFVLAMTSYVLALEVASGFTVRARGAMEPMIGMLLILLGPSALSRGELPAGLPLSSLSVQHPAVLDAACGAALVVFSRRLSKKAMGLPARSEEEIRVVDAAALLLFLNAVFQFISVSVRVLPVLLGGELGSGHVDW